MHAKRWVGYNIITYDNALLREEYRRLGFLPPKARRQTGELSTDEKNYRPDYFDLMYPYACWVGETGKHGDYKWQKLTRARKEFGIDTGDAHNALTDALATWHLLNKFREMELSHD